MDVFSSSGVVPFSVGETRNKDDIEESTVWQNLKETEILQFNSTVTRIAFSPIEPHSIVALSGISGPWIDGKTRSHVFSFAKAKAPFSAVAFRKDGVLIVLGKEDGAIDIFPVKDHQTLLRRFKLNSGVIFSVAFSPFANEVIVGTADGRIHIVEVASRHEIQSIKAHSDAVAAVVSLESGNLWASASYDGTVKIWDLTKQTEIASVSVGEAVSRMILHAGRLFVAAGENLAVINILGKPTLIAKFAAHTRPIVDLAVVRNNIVSASADRTIKVFDPSSFAVKHTLKLHGDITAFDALPDASSIAVAISGGVVQIKYVPTEREVVGKPRPELPANFRVFKRQVPKRNEEWNRAIRKFEFAEALDATLKNGDPTIIVGMLDELDRLGALTVALNGRDASALRPVLEFLIENVTNPVWSHVVLRAVVTIEKIYRPVIGEVPSIGNLFDKLASVIEEELATQKRAARLIGKIDLIVRPNQ